MNVSRFLRLPVAAVLILAAMWAPRISRADGDLPVNSYRVTPLGSLGGSTTHACGLNDAGQVTGTYSILVNGVEHSRAFSWQNGAMFDLGTLGGADSGACEINRFGRVVGAPQTAPGAYHPATGTGGTQAYLLQPSPLPSRITSLGGDQQVSLAWSTDAGGTEYRIKRSSSGGGPYGLVGTSSGTSFTQYGLSSGTTYYVVYAGNPSGESPGSNEASATPAGPPPPAPPRSLSANAGNRKVTLQWTQSTSADVPQNRAYRATASGGPCPLRATSTQASAKPR